MQDRVDLRDKRILLVDDEPDILETLKGILEMCVVDTAPDFETAVGFIEEHHYDAAVLDIMGVRGYDLLAITKREGIPTLMLTAHALSPENLVKSLKDGALAYVPKDSIGDIATFLQDILEAGEKDRRGLGRWFSRLERFFEEKFGPDWMERSDPEFWKKNYYI